MSPAYANTVLLRGSIPLRTTWSTNSIGGSIPTSCHCSTRPVVGKLARYVAANERRLSQSNAPTKTKVASPRSAKRSAYTASARSELSSPSHSRVRGRLRKWPWLNTVLKVSAKTASGWVLRVSALLRSADWYLSKKTGSSRGSVA